MTTELERIGDYAKGIARINLMIGEEPLLMPLVHIREMATQTQRMLQQALEAFTQRDADMARAIPDQDDVVDDLYNRVYADLMSFLLADPLNGEQVNFLLWAAHNLERAADRVTNLCERVIYTVTGDFVEMDPENSGLESIR
jgi:phosphate transport system protein